MPIYTLEGPDGRKYRIEGPEGATAEQLAQVVSGGESKSQDKPLQFARDIVGGAVRGAGSIGATLMRLFDTAEENQQRRQAMDAALTDLIGSNPENLLYKGGKLGAEIAGTAGVGGALARPVAAIAPKLATAIQSGGLVANGANMGTRMAGGAITGAASAGLVNPEDAATGGVIGGVLPPVVKGAGIAGRAAMDQFLSENAANALRVAKVAGATSDDDLKALRSALNTPRPSNIGVDLTVPQILQKPEVSQLARTIQNTGDMTLVNRAAEQQMAMRDAMSRVAKPANTVQEAAQDAGSVIERFAKAGKEAGDKQTNLLFQGVDPFNEARFILPRGELQATKNQFLGKGTFGMGDRASTALRVADDIGTEWVPGISMPGKVQSEETLLQAVKSAGGISNKSLTGQGLAGEIADLKQMGLGRVTNNTSGKSVEKMAEIMHGRGFLPDNDPATLLDALRNGGDDIAMGGGESAFMRARDMAMGDLPEDLVSGKWVDSPVSFKELQNYRSSLVSEIDKLASKPGNQSELAALTQMKKVIDRAVDRVASGKVKEGEYFPKDMVGQWRLALANKAETAQRFQTGPQSRIFARGADGQAAAQGAEVPRLFFNSLRSQGDDMAAFKRMAGGEQTLIDALKRYAVTSAGKSEDALGNLSNAKFNNWLESHSGALKGLLSDGDMATLNAIGQHLKTADSAVRLGMAPGSNTAQNIQSALSNGLIDNPLVTMLTNRLPVLKSTVGPVLEGVKKSATQARAEKIAGLLADPEVMDAAISELIARRSMGGLLGSNPTVKRIAAAGGKALPVVAAD